MRIEAYNQIASIYKTSKTGKVQQPYGVSIGRDEVQISRLGRDYQIAKQAVAETSDIREDKVSRLKNKMSTGSYSVDTGDFAEKLLAHYNAMNN